MGMLAMVKNWLFTRRLGLGLAVVLLVADQWSKDWALKALEDTPLTLIHGFLNLHLTFNKGVAFGQLGFMPVWGLAGFAFAAALALVHWLGHRSHWAYQLGLGCIIAGAVGNGIDRLYIGAVADFIDVILFGWHFYTFNVADIAINIGVALMLLDGFYFQRNNHP